MDRNAAAVDRIGRNDLMVFRGIFDLTPRGRGKRLLGRYLSISVQFCSTDTILPLSFGDGMK